MRPAGNYSRQAADGARRVSGAVPDAGPFDSGGSERNPLALPEHFLGAGRLAVDADQIVLRLAVRDPLAEELLDGGPFGDFDVIGETAAIVVDIENLHARCLQG